MKKIAGRPSGKIVLNYPEVVQREKIAQEKKGAGGGHQNRNFGCAQVSIPQEARRPFSQIDAQ